MKTMRPLTERERRTLRLGGLGIAGYLVLFFGFQTWRFAETRRREYQALQTEAAALQSRLTLYDDKVLVVRDLMEHFKLDPARLSRTTLVAQASAAIQKAALQGGIQLGPVRETPSRAAGRDLSAVQLEGAGPVPAILRFLQSIRTLGVPLITDSLQLSPAPGGPGQLKLVLTLVIPDFELWKTDERKPDA
jgi:hypothetical protein